MSNYGLGSRSFTSAEISAYVKYRLPQLTRNGTEARGACPVHDGKDANFTINRETGLWCCHSHCGGGDLIDLEMRMTGQPFQEASKSIELVVGRSPAVTTDPSTSYVYRNRNGEPVYRKIRRTGKRFSWESLRSDGVWNPGLEGVERVLYNLPEVIASDSVVYVEGEKDAEKLRALGFAATTAGAASDWRSEFAETLRGKSVVVLYDNDVPGKKHALQVCRDLLNTASDVTLVDLPGLQEKQDVFDWLNAGNSPEDLRNLIDSCEVLTSESLAAGRERLCPIEDGIQARSRSTLDVSQLPSVWSIESKLEWAVDGLLVRGGVTLLSAESGTGKSWVGYAIAGAVAHGRQFANREVEPLPVLYLDGENPVYVVQERLDALGIEETENLFVWGGWNESPPSGPGEDGVVRFAEETKGLIICDPLVAFHDGSEQDAGDTRRFMNRFRRLANLGATVLVMHHSGKAESSKQYRGSSDFKGSVDLAFTLRGEPNADGLLDRLSLSCFKGRVKPGQNLGMRFAEGMGLVPSSMPEAHAAEARLEKTIETIAEFLELNPGATKTAIEKRVTELSTPRETVRDALKAGELAGRWSTRSGKGRSVHYDLNETEELDVPVNRQTAAP